MEPMCVEISGGTRQLSADPLPFARNYQLEALEKAIKQNTIVFLETGSGKTLIAIMLLRSYAYLLRKPSPFFAVFVVPTVVLVQQQSEALIMHTDLKVGKYWGELGVDYWDAAIWNKQVDEYEVLVMTPAILLAALRHSFLKIDMIKVLIFDECHNARGQHPYACIMTEFYHQELNSKNSNLPRILGMTASPIKAKGCSSESAYWQQIQELENLMHSKIYTCASESVLAKYIPFSTPKLKFYEHIDIPYHVFHAVANELKMLRNKSECSLGKTMLSESMADSTRKRLDKIFSTLLFCLSELGVWLALKAAESLSSVRADNFLWEKVDVHGETMVKNFCLEASKVFSAWIPSGPYWKAKADIDAGYLTSKVICLIESLLEYREIKDLRCIIFVERIITAIVLKILLNELLPKLSGWTAAYTAGYNSCTQSQSRNEQNRTVEEFRNGRVNIIVATSMLEEGLDVQSCNLVIRFDPSATVCSFIQSRGRARMQNSHFLIMVKSGDTATLARVYNFLASGETMRQQSLIHTSVPCAPLDDFHMEAFHKVEATGAVVNLSSSVSLLYFYCSRLPNDGYFNPTPRFVFDKDSEMCTLHLPKGCPVQTVVVRGIPKKLKQLACLEACKKLHQIGALTDNLVPDIVEEEKDAQQVGAIGFGEHIDEQVKYVPPELVGSAGNDSRTLYYCYLIELEPDFKNDIKTHDIMLALRTRLEFDNETLNFDLDVDKGSLMVTLRYHGVIELKPKQVLLCQRFQLTILRVLIDRNLNKLLGVLGALRLRGESIVFDYLLLPSMGSRQNPLINWECVSSVLFPRGSKKHMDHNPTTCRGRLLRTFEDPVCSCMLENCLVVTPHNGCLYCISGILDKLDGNSLLGLNNGGFITYKAYYEQRHNITLRAVEQPLLRGQPVFPVQNYLQQCRNQKTKESRKASVELPPELCYVVMCPISVASFYSFCYAPSIVHRIESLLLAANLKRMLVDHCMQNDVIPTIKILEAITTKNCQEKFHLESLETLGDSFLKYSVSQQLFKTYQSHHEGLLSIKREKIISNTSLCKMGCDRKILGFIRNEPFDPKAWIIPGDNTGAYTLDGELLSFGRIFYSGGRRKIKSKRVADVVEALLGAFLDSGGELAALSFMEWLGIKVDFICVPYTMPIQVRPDRLVNVKFLESLLNYKFHDTSLLVEALTHGSYMVPEIPRCFQRLEFLGDAVLDYLITMYLYYEHPGLSPGLLTDLRSASVNNDCYAQSAVKAGLHRHIIHASQELQRQITTSVKNFGNSSVSTFGWESETLFPKVLGDIIESLAGAIFLDSGYSKEIVFQSIRPLLEPMITPETLKLHPVRELTELCQKEHYHMKKPIVACTNGKATITVEVEANGVIHKHSCPAADKKTAKRLACKEVLKLLKESIFGTERRSHIFGRNSLLFENMFQSPQVTVQRIIARADEFMAFPSDDHDPNMEPQLDAMSAWQPPPVGSLKLNVDGASVVGKSGIGGLMRDNEGTVLAAFSYPISSTSSSIGKPLQSLNTLMLGT